eukprot:COSAG05_NODE_20801_length_276_cov_1.762712_1_plen_46_part_01
MKEYGATPAAYDARWLCRRVFLGAAGRCSDSCHAGNLMMLGDLIND